jgi:DNA replication protein DnaC
MATAIVLYGPKAVGKSWVAAVLRYALCLNAEEPG